MDKLEDFLRYSVLFLYYGELFSKKQKQYLELYLEENSSFTEIAEKYGVTRQAVFDNIKRGFKQLEEYESKLKIFEREKELKKRLENLKSNLETIFLNHLKFYNVKQEMSLGKVICPGL